MNAWVECLNQWAEVWRLYVGHGGWQAALVAGLLLTAVALGRRWPAPLRYGIVALALLKFVCPPLWPLPTGVFSRVELPAAIAAAPQAATLVRSSPSIVQPNRHIANHVASPVPATLGLSAWLMLTHGMVGSWLVARVLLQSWRLRRLVRSSQPCPTGDMQSWLETRCRQLGIRRRVSLCFSHQADSPIALGILRPSIVLPHCTLELPRRDIETMLVHELAHLRRGDAAMVWLQALVCAVWWFHPLAWLTSRAMRRIREDCCDDLLLLSGVTTESGYCDTLLRVARQFPQPAPLGLACGMAERLHPLASRLTRILDGEACRRAGLSPIWSLTLVALAGVILPGLAPATAVERASGGTESVAEGNPGAAASEKVVALGRSLDGSPAPDAPHDAADLAGDWLLSLPAGFQHEISLKSLGPNRYRLTPNKLNSSGVYELRGDRLVMVATEHPNGLGFEWRRLASGQWRLVGQPDLARVGSNYLGATLSREAAGD